MMDKELKAIDVNIDQLAQQKYNQKKMEKLINQALDFMATVAYDIADTDDTIDRSEYGMKALYKLRSQINNSAKLSDNAKESVLGQIDEATSIAQGIANSVIEAL